MVYLLFFLSFFESCDFPKVFLELFDTEVRGYKAPNFEFLIKDAALLLPVSGTPMSRLDLSRRLPSGQVEQTQKAIQQYLVLRELKYRT